MFFSIKTCLPALNSSVGAIRSTELQREYIVYNRYFNKSTGD